MTILNQLTTDDYADYVRICCFLGGFKDLIQGSGGNISVKSTSEVCIKSSGRCLAYTTSTTNHVTCSIEQLEILYKNKDDTTISSVIRGDVNSSPSMEIFFHLLPSKWIIHLHPTWLLRELCTVQWEQKAVQCELSHRCIPYKTPGFELSSYIRDSYKGESVLFLQNHGVILCGDTIHEILTILDTLHRQFTVDSSDNQEYTKMYKFLYHVRETTGHEMYIKSCSMIKHFHDRLFLPITPDITLFLKQCPLAQETEDVSLERLLDNYMGQFQCLPTVIRTLKGVYILGKTFTQCICIKEVLESYLDIIRSQDPNTFTLLGGQNIHSLVTSEKEKYRLQLT